MSISNIDHTDILFTYAPDGIIVINDNGVIIQWNPAAENIFGWTASEVKGRLLHEVIIPERYREAHLQGLLRFKSAGQGPIIGKTVQLPALSNGGLELQIELTIAPIRVDNEQYFMAFLRDVSDRIQKELTIKRLNETLESQVQERTEQLKRSESKYKNLFENNPMPMWILELPSLRFIDVNESAVKHYGFSREEFLSMTANAIRPADQKERFAQLDRTTIGTHNAGSWQHIIKSGKRIDVEIFVHEINIDGKPCRLILCNDITDKKASEDALKYSEAKFRRIFEANLIGFVFWNGQGEIIEANDVFLHMLGYSRNDLLAGKINWNQITPPELRHLNETPYKEVAEKGFCEPSEKVYLRSNGARVPVLVGAAVLEGGYETTGVAYILDITLRKALEDEVRELNRDLESKVILRTEQLQKVNKELESFSYSVSHDLRAPLRAIHGYSQIIIEDYANVLDSEGKRLLQTVMQNAKKMGQLIDDLLQFSKVAKGGIKPVNLDITDLVREVTEELLNGMANTPAITIKPLGNGWGDPSMLRHVFQNLISNAIKYSASTPECSIEIGTEDNQGEKTYYVKDNGAGFDMAYYDKLFGVFQRLHRDEEFEGNGVGLAIVQRIIYRHGGKVWATGKVNEGATFYFTLPSKNQTLL